jgi:hypothetical protein
MATPRYNPYAQNSGTDPRGRLQNQGAYQQQRYESQQGPLANQLAYQTGRANEADYGNYTNMMNMYGNIASGGGPSGAGRVSSGGSGGAGVKAVGHTYTPFLAEYKDPFNSYAGFTEFSNTGGYSADDIANMRARGASPIRAAYANAERELQRGRSLQGGYSPNAAAAQVRMAREQGQAAADATQNVEAGLAEARNKGRLAGLTGMSGIEGQRLGADVDLSKFNAGQRTGAQANTFASADRASAANRSSAESRAARSSAASAASTRNQMDALAGMRSLYGTTPGMSEMFGNQAINIVGQGGNYGLGVRRQDYADQSQPGQYDTTMGRIRDIGGLVGQGINIGNEIYQGRKKKPAVNYSARDDE